MELREGHDLLIRWQDWTGAIHLGAHDVAHPRAVFQSENMPQLVGQGMAHLVQPAFAPLKVGPHLNGGGHMGAKAAPAKVQKLSAPGGSSHRSDSSKVDIPLKLHPNLALPWGDDLKVNGSSHGLLPNSGRLFQRLQLSRSRLAHDFNFDLGISHQEHERLCLGPFALLSRFAGAGEVLGDSRKKPFLAAEGERCRRSTEDKGEGKELHSVRLVPRQGGQAANKKCGVR